MDINKMQSFISQVKSLENSPWTSRKLWITIASIGALVYLFQATLPLIIWPVTIISAVYLICSTVENKIVLDAKTKTKLKLIEVMSKDGQITPEEAEVINKVNWNFI